MMLCAIPIMLCSSHDAAVAGDPGEVPAHHLHVIIAILRCLHSVLYGCPHPLNVCPPPFNGRPDPLNGRPHPPNGRRHSRMAAPIPQRLPVFLFVHYSLSLLLFPQCRLRIP